MRVGLGDVGGVARADVEALPVDGASVVGTVGGGDIQAVTLIVKCCTTNYRLPALGQRGALHRGRDRAGQAHWRGLYSHTHTGVRHSGSLRALCIYRAGGGDADNGRRERGSQRPSQRLGHKAAMASAARQPVWRAARGGNEGHFHGINLTQMAARNPVGLFVKKLQIQ